MLRSAHLALSPKRLTDDQIRGFLPLQIYSYEKIHTASLGTSRWADLCSRHHITDVVTCSQMSPTRLPNDAVCILYSQSMSSIYDQSTDLRRPIMTFNLD